MSEPKVVRYIAWAPHTRRAFCAPTEAEAKSDARWYVKAYEGVMPQWRTMEREGWRVSKVTSDE